MNSKIKFPTSIVGAALFAWLMSCWTRQVLAQNLPLAPSSTPTLQAMEGPPTVATTARIPYRTTATALREAAAPSEIQFGKDFHRRYFRETLLSIPAVAELHQALVDHLPSTPAMQLASMYIARGLAPGSSPEYAAFLLQLRSEINAHADEMFAQLLVQDPVLKQCPFCYQMTLNLAAGLDLDTSKKARLLGKAFEQQFSIDDKGNISVLSASMTNALILMRAAGVRPEEAQPYVAQGIETNRTNPRGLAELMARVRVYYPSLAQ